MTTADGTGSNDTPGSDEGGNAPQETQGVAADVTSPGEPLTQGEDAPTSGPLSSGHGGGTAAGRPVAGIDSPSSEPVYPEGSDESDGAASASEDADPAEPGGRG
jgi:hypothetical protein